MGIRASMEGGGRGLKWEFEDTGTLGEDERGKERVLDEEVWAVLQVNVNASMAFQQALQRGYEAYEAADALTLFFASSRNQVATLSVAVPAVIGVVNPILAQLGVALMVSFLNSTKGDAGSLARALRCETCFAGPFAVRHVDLVPFTPPVAFGTLNTGLIFVSLPSPMPTYPFRKQGSRTLALNLHIQRLHRPARMRRYPRFALHTMHATLYSHHLFLIRLPLSESHVYVGYPRFQHPIDWPL
jgi:hypothetical protein